MVSCEGSQNRYVFATRILHHCSTACHAPGGGLDPAWGLCLCKFPSLTDERAYAKGEVPALRLASREAGVVIVRRGASTLPARLPQLLHRRQLHEPTPGLGHPRLELGLRVFPERDERAVVGDGFRGVAPSFVQLAEALVDHGP